MAEGTARLGFLQLCADRRFHHAVMSAFEEATGLEPDEYWIEAGPGGSVGQPELTAVARLAHENGAAVMGWAAHGGQCLGFPDSSDSELRDALAESARARARDLPGCEHHMLFADEDGVHVRRVS